MRKTSETDKLLHELERCREALVTYKNNVKSQLGLADKYHAAARRATLDLTRQLTEWRRTNKPFSGIVK